MFSFNLQNSLLQCQNSIQMKVLPGRKWLNNAVGFRHRCCESLCRSWHIGPGPWMVLGSFLLFFSFSPPPSAFLSLAPYWDRPSRRAEGEKGLARGEIDNKTFKASELPTAKPLSRQRGARQPPPSQALHPHQPWQKAGRETILTIWLRCWPDTKIGPLLQLVLWTGLPLVLIVSTEPGFGLSCLEGTLVGLVGMLLSHRLLQGTFKQPLPIKLDEWI